MADKLSPSVAAAGALEEAVVKRGVVVWGAGPYSHARARHDPPELYARPGDKVRLPRDTVAKLRRTGVLVAAGAEEIPVGLGPNFNVDEGVQIVATAPAAATNG